MRRAIIFIGLLLPAMVGHAAGLSGLYSEAVLQERQPKYAKSIRWNFDNLIIGSLTPRERARVGSVQLSFPLRGAGTLGGDPLAFYAAGRTITVPIQSVKFFDDLTVAWGYFWANELPIEPVTDYLGMLKYRDPVDMGGRFPPPFEALGVPADAWKSDPKVDDVSQKALKSAIVWILAHELGHIYHRHPGNGPQVARALSQRNEAEADRFANTIMRRIGVAPMGMAQFFMMMAHFAGNRSDYPDQAAWERYLATEQTHPLTGDRMRALAADLRRSPEDFTAEEWDRGNARQRILYVADQIEEIGRFLNDTGIQRSIAAKALATDLAALQRWKPSVSVADGDPDKPFQGYYRGQYIHLLPGEETESLDADMRLEQNGKRVTGRFDFGLGEGRIEGIVRAGILRYEWRWGTATGRGLLQADGQGGLTGEWGYREAARGGGRWDVSSN